MRIRHLQTQNSSCYCMHTGQKYKFDFRQAKPVRGKASVPIFFRIPKYNQTILEIERKRMIEKSGCNYLEDLITCVHISVLKSLTCIRVGNRQKKIDLSIPKLDSFIHKVYINVGRKIYMNTDLYILDIPLHQKQKNRKHSINNYQRAKRGIEKNQSKISTRPR